MVLAEEAVPWETLAAGDMEVRAKMVLVDLMVLTMEMVIPWEVRARDGMVLAEELRLEMMMMGARLVPLEGARPWELERIRKTT